MPSLGPLQLSPSVPCRLCPVPSFSSSPLMEVALPVTMLEQVYPKDSIKDIHVHNAHVRRFQPST